MWLGAMEHVVGARGLSLDPGRASPPPWEACPEGEGQCPGAGPRQEEAGHWQGCVLWASGAPGGTGVSGAGCPPCPQPPARPQLRGPGVFWVSSGATKTRL